MGVLNVDVALDVLRTLNLTFAALAVGAAVLEAVVIVPAARSLADRGELLRTLRLSPGNRSYAYLLVSGILSLVTALAIVALWNQQPMRAAVLTAIGLALFALAAGLNAAYWGLSERRLQHGEAPVDDAFLRTLQTRGVARAVCYVVGFVCFAAAATAA